MDLAGNATKVVNIDGVEYTVQNKLATAQALSYIKDNSTGEITFLGSDFKITAQSDVKHNIIINGSRNEFHGGDLDDIIESVLIHTQAKIGL